MAFIWVHYIRRSEKKNNKKKTRLKIAVFEISSRSPRGQWVNCLSKANHNIAKNSKAMCVSCHTLYLLWPSDATQWQNCLSSLALVMADNTKQLPERILISHQWGQVAFSCMQSAQVIYLCHDLITRAEIAVPHIFYHNIQKPEQTSSWGLSQYKNVVLPIKAFPC